MLRTRYQKGKNFTSHRSRHQHCCLSNFIFPRGNRNLSHCLDHEAFLLPIRCRTRGTGGLCGNLLQGAVQWWCECRLSSWAELQFGWRSYTWNALSMEVDSLSFTSGYVRTEMQSTININARIFSNCFRCTHSSHPLLHTGLVGKMDSFIRLEEQGWAWRMEAHCR